MTSYLDLYRNGKLSERTKAARDLLLNCHICPRCCNINRLIGETGKCHTGELASISNYGPHFGEESPLVGKYGSGTIFFTNCNLKCIYCQNYSISQLGNGKTINKEELAEIMLYLQAQGCHNINLVSPTHVVPQILEALEIAIALGLRLPLVYNSGGYDSVETLKILDGIIDIYMPDMKYSDSKIAKDLSGIENYTLVNRAAVREMHRQVGNLQVDDEGIAIRGLLIRHLVLPDGLAGTNDTVRFIAKKISANSYLNIMDQYRPCFNAFQLPQLARPISQQELLEAIESTHGVGLSRLDKVHQVFV